MTTYRAVRTRRLTTTIHCPTCEHSMTKTLHWLKRHFYTTCTECGQSFGLERGLYRSRASRIHRPATLFPNE